MDIRSTARNYFLEAYYYYNYQRVKRRHRELDVVFGGKECVAAIFIVFWTSSSRDVVEN